MNDQKKAILSTEPAVLFECHFFQLALSLRNFAQYEVDGLIFRMPIDQPTAATAP